MEEGAVDVGVNADIIRWKEKIKKVEWMKTWKKWS